MGLKTAVGQLAVVIALLAVCTAVTRYHVASLNRADFSQSEFFEDSKSGNGSRYRVVTRSADTGGASFSVEVLTRRSAVSFLPDQPGSTPEHSHAQQQEELLVQQGKLGYLLRKQQQQSSGVLGPGEHLVIPAGTAHVLYNVDNTTDVLYQLTHAPAGPLGEAFFENLAGLGWDYGSLDRIHPLQVLVLYDAADTQLTDVSGVLAPIVKHVLLPVSKWLGFKADYPSHRTKVVGSAGEQQQGQEQISAADEASGGTHEEL